MTADDCDARQVREATNRALRVVKDHLRDVLAQEREDARNGHISSSLRYSEAIRSLVMSLKRYGQHDKDCIFVKETKMQCDCGYWEALNKGG